VGLWAGSRVNLWDDGAIIAATNAPEQLKLSQRIFMIYFLLTHIDTAGFALRLCLALVLVKSKIESYFDASSDAIARCRSAMCLPTSQAPKRNISASFLQLLTPPSPSPELTSQPLPNSEVIHAVIVPNYSETLETLQTTLEVFASYLRARTQYEVC
jgi:hypothetical protein